jgi:hypothetical protein
MRIDLKEHFDTASIVIIIITFTFFVVALFTKGFTHDLLLEAGILLVSVKLIMMAYKNSMHVDVIEKELSEIKELLRNKHDST